MAHPLTLALLGLWHVHADDYARDAHRHPDVELDAVWDPDPAAARDAAGRLGAAPAADLDALLARDDLDGVVVTTETTRHTDVVGRALAAGKHVFTEKLLAPTTAECEQLVAAAHDAGRALVVSLPRLAEPVVRTARRLRDDGALGDLTYVRVRMAHDGWVGDWLPERFADPDAAVGGALSDLGAHPVYVVQHLLGADPADVVAAYGHVTGRAVEDNALVALRYDGGALGVAEASFVTTPGAFALEVRGTRGSLLHGFGGTGLLAKGDDFGDGWTAVDLDEAGTPPFDAWVAAMRGEAPAPDLAPAVELTRAVVAANAAARA